MKLSISIPFDDNFANNIAILSNLEIDYIHIDAFGCDGLREKIETIRKLTHIPIDVHAVSGNLKEFFTIANKYNIELLSLQYENFLPLSIPGKISGLLGLAILNSADINEIASHEAIFDFIMYMATVPGVSGKKFEASSFNYIKKLRKAFPYKRLHVDGGVTPEISFILKILGVSCIVSGSFVVNSFSKGVAIGLLRQCAFSSDVLIKDFMISANESPVVVEDSTSVMDCLNVMVKQQKGILCYMDKKGFFTGMTTSGDILRVLLKSIESSGKTFDFSITDLINRTPLTISPNSTVAELLCLVEGSTVPVLNIPVVDNAGKFVGLLNFSNLVRGGL